MDESTPELITEMLESLLFTQGRFVTALTLARHAEVDEQTAAKVMGDFYADGGGVEGKKEGLYGVYVLSGERSDYAPMRRDATLLVREADLEEKRASFSRLDSCTLFSLQTKPLKNLNTLFTSDRLDNADFHLTDHKRFKTAYTDIEEGREMWKNAIMAMAKPRIPTAFDALRMAQGGRPLPKKMPEKADIQKLFKKACDKEKTPKNSPKKVQPSPFSSLEKQKKDKEKSASVERKKSPSVEVEKKEDEEASRSPVFSRKRQRKIFIDDEDDSDVKEVAATKKPVASKKEAESETNQTKKATEPITKKRPTTVEKKESAKKKTNIIESDDDIFDTGDSSPEKAMEVDEESPKPKSSSKTKKETKVKSSHTLEETGALRRSPRKHTDTTASSSSSSGPAKKLVRKEMTYMDDDGFLVTRMETVEEELTEAELQARKKKEEEEKARQPLQTASKKTNVPAVPAKAGSKKNASAAAGQSKISSFFTKK